LPVGLEEEIMLDANLLIQLTEELRQWQQHWRPLIERWVAINDDVHPEFARVIHYVPDLLVLVVNLIKDPRIDDPTRQSLYATSQYVMEAQDDLPEAELGAPGLVDDALQMVDQLMAMVGRYAPYIQNNWSASGDVLEIIEFVDGQRNFFEAGE
jgi:hypothetical protein